MLNPLQSPSLSQFPLIKHGFFTRQGGVSEGMYASLNLSHTRNDHPDHVQENQKRIIEWFEGHPLLLMDQIHGDNILFINTLPDIKTVPKVDGLITPLSGVILGIRTADCIPLLFVDPEAQLIGAVHSGWRGTLKNIAGKTVQEMKKYGAKKIYASLGPAISQTHFEVGLEVYEAFRSNYASFFKRSLLPDRYLCDLKGIVTKQLSQEDIVSIDTLPYDTYAMSDLFFSCRRATHQHHSTFGCQLSGIMLTSAGKY